MAHDKTLSMAFLLILLCDCSIALWWSLGHKEPLVFHNRICRRIRKLKSPQKILCRRSPEVISEVIRGSSAALRECGSHFRHQRWNCTLHKKSLKRILKQDSKEAAILNAFVSAGVMHAVAESCSKGRLTQCDCGSYNEIGPQYEISGPGPSSPGTQDQKTSPWHWRGCSSATRYGYKISRKMNDANHRRAKAKQSDVRTSVRIHNNEVGRRVVMNSRHEICKCHGLSGSCHFKTCTFSLPSLRRVAKVLLQKYLKAVKVISTNDGKKITSAEGRKKLKKDDLAYLEESPNFCRRNLRVGSLGTSRRECNATTTSASGSCRHLCCGRGYNTHLQQVQENCSCKFEFCCKVTCNKCLVPRSKTFCN